MTVWYLMPVSFSVLLASVQTRSQHSGDATQEEHAGKWKLRRQRHHGRPADAWV